MQSYSKSTCTIKGCYMPVSDVDSERATIESVSAMKQVLIVGVCLLAFCAQVHAEPGLDCSRPPYGASYETYKAFLQSI